MPEEVVREEENHVDASEERTSRRSWSLQQLQSLSRSVMVQLSRQLSDHPNEQKCCCEAASFRLVPRLFGLKHKPSNVSAGHQDHLNSLSPHQIQTSASALPSVLSIFHCHIFIHHFCPFCFRLRVRAENKVFKQLNGDFNF